MSLSSGTRLGPYEIVAALGAGGMGEVYRAHDTKLNRDVALKILASDFTTDPERLARFKREAQVLASLNHPHIAQIYGFEDSGSTHALVLELVEGPTLADRIAWGPLATDAALAIAKQIADALEAAHEQGIIHRDLKPANINVRNDGIVKVLDFGLAKAMGPASSRPDLSNSPTLTSPAMLTGVGMILGTAAYMAPEQAKGRPADKRSDIWSFGCVLYEMLTGKRAFEGDDVGDTLANVLKTEPDWTALPAGTAPSIRRLLRRCLAKDRARRLSDAVSARLEIDEASSQEGTGQVPVYAMRRLERVAWSAAVIVTAAIAAFLTFSWTARPAVPAPIVRFRVTLPEGPNYYAPPVLPLGLSADGGSIVYGVPRGLMVHTFADDQTRTILNADLFPSTPTFSPDGRWVAFFQTAGLGLVTLKKVATTGGAAVTLADRVPPPLGASWSDTYIVFGTSGKGVIRVSQNGGAPETVVSPTQGEVLQSPQLLPGGDAILLTVAPLLLASGRSVSAGVPIADWDRADIVVQSLKTGQRKTLISGATDGRYVTSGHLVFVRGGVLFAAPFDFRHLAIVGGSVPVIEGVRRTTTAGSALYAFSNNGSLVYQSGPARGNVAGTTLAWTTTTGAVERLDVPAGVYATPRIAPDEKQAAVTNTDASGSNVWIVDLSRGRAMRRLTFGGGNKCPVWSPAGDRIVFQSDREGDLGIYSQRADGTGTAERLTKAARGVAQIPESWAPDGKHLLFSATDGSEVTLWTLSPEKGQTAPFGNVRSTQPTNAVFSPDGRWVAYGSTESGTAAVYVQPFPATGVKYQVSRGDIGHHALWSRDGRLLFYIPLPGRLVFVNVRTQSGFAFSTPTPAPRGFTIGNAQTDLRNHDIDRAGRLLGIVPAGQEAGATSPQQIDVVLNWFEELHARVPVK